MSQVGRARANRRGLPLVVVMLCRSANTFCSANALRSACAQCPACLCCGMSLALLGPHACWGCMRARQLGLLLQRPDANQHCAIFMSGNTWFDFYRSQRVVLQNVTVAVNRVTVSRAHRRTVRLVSDSSPCAHCCVRVSQSVCCMLSDASDLPRVVWGGQPLPWAAARGLLRRELRRWLHRPQRPHQMRRKSVNT